MNIEKLSAGSVDLYKSTFDGESLFVSFSIDDGVIFEITFYQVDKYTFENESIYFMDAKNFFHLKTSSYPKFIMTEQWDLYKI